MTADTARIQEIEKRLKAATPGQWQATKYQVVACNGDHVAEVTAYDNGSEELGRDYELIAHAPSDLQFLIDENARLRAERDHLKDVSLTQDYLAIAESLLAKLAASETRLARIRAHVDEQAKDDGLWAVPWDLQPISEAYLQQELRRLHATIEANTEPQPGPIGRNSGDSSSYPQDASKNPGNGDTAGGLEKLGGCI
jgi:hypothetical protein